MNNYLPTIQRRNSQLPTYDTKWELVTTYINDTTKREHITTYDTKRELTLSFRTGLVLQIKCDSKICILTGLWSNIKY